MYMHSPVRAALREALGDIGKVWTAHFDFSQYSSKYPAYLRGELPNIFNPAMATGSLMDLGIYCVYPAIDLFGEPKTVSAVSAFLESGADAATAVSMLSKNTAITMISCKTGQDHAGSQIIGERGSIKIGSISKLTDIELVMNDGTSRIICGDTPKDELMGNEARAFYKLITEPENNREKYRELRETALSVSRTMQRIRESAGIKFDGGIA
jgi:predicted dehydrogenase